MKVIINVPDEMFDAAVRLVREESRDYRRRYDKPGWGWTFPAAGHPGHRFWCKGIKDGLSVSMVKDRASASTPGNSGRTP